MTGRVLNINVGVLGHVDSGKTSLVRALSQFVSTAALDKSPQSQERGITLDLGFSAFRAELPAHLETTGFAALNVTLVDCPGHASLIRTIIGGAQIIEICVLVLDATKGIQTQTAECIVIAEITARDLVVVINKVDLLAADDRDRQLARVCARVASALSGTKFKGAEVVLASAAGGEGVKAVVEAIRRRAQVPSEELAARPFRFSVDHCFSIKGHGTVLTGTVLAGKVEVGDSVELPALGMQRKVKSLQVFRAPVLSASCGDRVGLCLTNLDAKLIERGVVCAAGAGGTVCGVRAVVCLVTKVRFFQSACPTGSRLHVSMGHSHEVAVCTFFGAKELTAASAYPQFRLDDEFETQSGLTEGVQWALLEFSNPVLCSVGEVLLGCRLDGDVKAGEGSKCRIAFHGVTSLFLPDDRRELRLFSWRMKHGVVDSLCQVSGGVCRELLASGLFARGGVDALVGVRARTESGYVGTVSGAYGKDGQVRVQFPQGARQVLPGSALTLRYKRYVGCAEATLVQGEELDCPVELVAADKEMSGTNLATLEAAHSSNVVRSGRVESVKEVEGGKLQAVVIGMFRMEENVRDFAGRCVLGPGGLLGAVVGPFGKMGKCKVEFQSESSLAIAKDTLLSLGDM